MGWFCLRVSGHLEWCLYSLTEPCKLLQWVCRNCSTKDFGMGIVFLWLYCYAKHKMQLTVTDIVWPTKMAELIEVLFGLG